MDPAVSGAADASGVAAGVGGSPGDVGRRHRGTVCVCRRASLARTLLSRAGGELFLLSAVAVLSKAVDEGDDAGGAGECRAPLLEGEVGGDYRRTLLVASTDDVVEDVGGARIAGV